MAEELQRGFDPLAIGAENGWNVFEKMELLSREQKFWYPKIILLDSFYDVKELWINLGRTLIREATCHA